MTLMLLGIVPAGVPVPQGTPDHGAIAVGDWTGLTWRLPEGFDLASEEGTIRFAQARHEILCHYAGAADVIPVAPGDAFSDAGAVAQRIDRDVSRIAGLHARLAGCAEYALTIDTEPEADAAMKAATGRDHLRLRARMRDMRGERSNARHRFVEGFASGLGDVVEAHRTVAGRAAPRLARVDLLLRRDRIGACTAAITARLDEARNLGLRLSLTGPYPPFSFLDGALDD